MKTYTPRAAEIRREWYIVDASGQTLGRLASEIAQVLRGKRKPVFAPHMDVGDYVIVINAAKIEVTGRKADQKTYYSYSGHPGGIKGTTYRQMMQNNPGFVIRSAVKGMLPKGRLGTATLSKLKVYSGEDHPHQAQKPKDLGLTAE
jgi:large subunit ribosomal protein L13